MMIGALPLKTQNMHMKLKMKIQMQAQKGTLTLNTTWKTHPWTQMWIQKTILEVQVASSQSLSQVGVEVIPWIAHRTSYSVSWLYQSFLNYPNKFVHCIPMCHFCTGCIDSIISFILYVIFSIVVAQGLDNLPSQPSILQFFMPARPNTNPVLTFVIHHLHPYVPTFHPFCLLFHILLKFQCEFGVGEFLWQVFSLGVLCFKYLSATPPLEVWVLPGWMHCPSTV